MSLINQMLKDLEAREQGSQGLAELPQGVHAVEEPVRRVPPAVLLLVGCVLMAAAAALWFFLKPAENPASGIPAAGTVAMVPPASPQPALPSPSAVAAPAVPEMPVPATPAPTPAPVVTPLPAPAEKSAQAVVLPPAQPAAKAVPAEKAAPSRGKPVVVRRGPRPEQAHLPEAQAVTADSLYQRGKRAYAEGRPAGAREDLERALRLEPEHRPARLLLARCEAALGEEEAALSLLDEDSDLRSDADAGKLRAQLLLKLGRTRQAESILESLSANHADPEVQGILGAMRQRQGRYGEAVAHYRQALQAQPGQPRWWLGLAVSLEAGERFQEALEAYGRAAELSGLSPDVQVYVARRIEALRGQR